MATKVSIISTQEFTSSGSLGSLLFILGPCGSAIGYAWLLSELSKAYDSMQNTGGPAILIGGGGLAFLFGCVLMLVGRTYSHQVSVENSPN